MNVRFRSWALWSAVLVTWLVSAEAQAADALTHPPGCALQSLRVVRSSGDTVEHLGAEPGLPELCRLKRTSDAEGLFYLGLWRIDWPGAGQAYPAIRTAMLGASGTRTSFVTRSWSGMQWMDSYRNEGEEFVPVGGIRHRAPRLAHEREGIEGNTYHSVITPLDRHGNRRHAQDPRAADFRAVLWAENHLECRPDREDC